MVLDIELKRDNSESTEIHKKAVTDFMNQLYNTVEIPSNRREFDIARELVEIVDTTELPLFDTPDKIVTSSSNDVVKKKAIYLAGIKELDRKIIPRALDREYSGGLDNEEELKVAPWVNMIHAWFKVINVMNTVSAIQNREIPYTPSRIACLARELYNFTTFSDGNILLRSEYVSLTGDNPVEYIETEMRRASTKGVNPLRHISQTEMKYILHTIKESFPPRSI